MLDIHVMSVALIGPEEQRRKAVASALTGSQADGTAYPGNINMTCNNWVSSEFGKASLGFEIVRILRDAVDARIQSRCGGARRKMIRRFRQRFTPRIACAGRQPGRKSFFGFDL